MTTRRSSWKDFCDTCDTTVRTYSRRYGWTDEPALSAELANEILGTAEADGLFGQSKINPGLSREQIHEVLVGGVPSNGDPLPSLTSRHILREFRKQAKSVRRGS